jgi:serine/threonine protein kinase
MKHPSPDQLAAFGLGKLLGPSADTVVAHLETCIDCRRAVASLPADRFVGRIQVADAGVAPSTVPPELANHPDYRIVRELGRGGMGVVYLARNTIMDRDEVLKVAHRALLEKPGASDRFLQEIRSAAQLMHVNVVRAYSVLRLSDLLVFAMEYVPGDDLSKIVRKQGSLPVAHACFYAAHVALGLQHAHEKGMVHRDIKPSNLILSKDGKKPVVKILDFGLAKMTSEVGFARDLTGSNKMMGTPDYIAPEQILNAAKADIRADIYSLGCTLYYLLSGSPPFTGGSLYEVLHAHSAASAKPLNLVRPEVPAELAAVVAKMLAKEPRKRHQTPGDVARELQPFTKPGAAPASTAPRVQPVPSRKSASRPGVSPKAQGPVDAPKLRIGKAGESSPFAFGSKTMLVESASKQVRDRRRLWYCLAATLAIGVVGAFVIASGALRVQTPVPIANVELPKRAPKNGPAEATLLTDAKPPPELKTPRLEIKKIAGVDPGKIDAAIRRGVDFLQKTAPPWADKDSTRKLGVAALTGLALLECGTALDHPLVQQVVNSVRADSAENTNTYEIALGILFLDRLRQGRDRGLIQTLAARLVAGQDPTGGWQYRCPVLTQTETEQLLSILQRNRPKAAPLLVPFSIDAERPKDKREDVRDPVGAASGNPQVAKATADDRPMPPKILPRSRLMGEPAQFEAAPTPLPATALTQRLQDLTTVKQRDRSRGSLEVEFNDPGGDLSNTQFAILALWAARRHGVVSDRSLLLTEFRLRKTQNAAGSWQYREVPGSPQNAAMVCCGLLGLALGTAADQRHGPSLTQALQTDPAIQRALDRLGELSGDPRPDYEAVGKMLNVYSLWSTGRVAIIYRQETLRGKDWYGWGAQNLIKNQDANGSWNDPQGIGHIAFVDTSLALLFLARSNPVQEISEQIHLHAPVQDR